MEISILGAGRCVTGSKFLLRTDKVAALLDCGLFQGPAEHRRRNWQPLPFAASRIGSVVLTHAHIDHSGFLPRLVRQGFAGRVFCTKPTKALLHVLLPDAAHINEEEARYANRKGYSKHAPALPLFRLADARAALRLLEPVPFHTWTEIGPGTRFRFHRQGHILGAAAVELQTKVSGAIARPSTSPATWAATGSPSCASPSPTPVRICSSWRAPTAIASIPAPIPGSR